ncbi:MAG TPA: hypothetical protein VND23_03920 [Acidimicrobiales bacterium]|nr:hypothetical protein [Acidimicrobiales bacterium]
MPGVKRIELVVVAALVVSLPSFAEAFDGGITVATALVRLSLGLLVCWAVGAIVERTIDTYAREARQKEIERRVTQSIAARNAFWSAPPGHDNEQPTS